MSVNNYNINDLQDPLNKITGVNPTIKKGLEQLKNVAKDNVEGLKMIGSMISNSSSVIVWIIIFILFFILILL